MRADLAQVLNEAAQEADERLGSEDAPMGGMPFRDTLFRDSELSVHGPAMAVREDGLRMAAEGFAKLAMGSGPIVLAQALEMAITFGSMRTEVNGCEVRIKPGELFLEVCK